MCDVGQSDTRSRVGVETIPVRQAAGMVLAHDITEIRKDAFKGRAFKKGHIIREDDICHLQRLGKEHVFVLKMAADEMHEDDAAYAIARALMGDGVTVEGEPKEGKINIVAERDGLLKIHEDALRDFNMLGEVMCASLHNNTVVREKQVVAGTRAIPLVVKRSIIDEAVRIARGCDRPTIEVKEIRKPKAGIVITGNEIYYGRIQDAFAPIIRAKVEQFGGETVGVYYAPDDEAYIAQRMRELIEADADLLITTGGMSVDPDDVTRFAIRNLGATDITYGSAALPGAMLLVAYVDPEAAKGGSTGGREHGAASSRCIPVIGVPACGMYHKITVFDLILPRILAGETIGRRDLAELGHGGLCLNCKECRYPLCPFGK